jgi:hypothetical protein
MAKWYAPALLAANVKQFENAPDIDVFKHVGYVLLSRPRLFRLAGGGGSISPRPTGDYGAPLFIRHCHAPLFVVAKAE